MGAHLVEIVVQGRLGPSLVAALEGFTVEDAGLGVTRVTGLVPDQSMLFGVLDMLDGLHIEVVSVNRVDTRREVSSVPGDTHGQLRP